MADIPARNCLFSVNGYGGVLASATRIEHGISILSSESSTRHNRVLLPRRKSLSHFKINIKHTTRSEFNQFNEWMKVYAESISSPDGSYGAMRVFCPAASFDRMCVPVSGVSFGVAFNDFVWSQTLEFSVASSPVDITDVSAEISYGVGVTHYVGTSDEQPSSYSIATLGGLSSLGGTLEDALYNSYGPKVLASAPDIGKIASAPLPKGVNELQRRV